MNGSHGKNWEADGERGPAAFLTFDRDVSAMLVENLPGAGKTNAATSNLTDDVAPTIKPLEKPGLVFKRHSNALIAHLLE